MMHSKDARGTRGILKSAKTATDAAVTRSAMLTVSLVYLAGSLTVGTHNPNQREEDAHQRHRTTNALWPLIALS